MKTRLLLYTLTFLSVLLFSFCCDDDMDPCFQPNISDVTITHVADTPVDLNGFIVQDIDCSVYPDAACQVQLDGTSTSVYEQRDCAKLIVLLEPKETDRWYRQNDIPEPNASGTWNTTIQLGDTTAIGDPRGEGFNVLIYATSVPFNSIPSNFTNDSLSIIFPAETSRAAEQVTILVNN